MITLIATWLLYKKAGEHGWAAIIPLYSTYVSFKIVFGNGWKMFLMLIPFYNIYIAIKYIFGLAKVFGKSTGFGFGLLFLSPFFTWALGFGSAQYQGPIQ